MSGVDAASLLVNLGCLHFVAQRAVSLLYYYGCDYYRYGVIGNHNTGSQTVPPAT